MRDVRTPTYVAATLTLACAGPLIPLKRRALLYRLRGASIGSGTLIEDHVTICAGRVAVGHDCYLNEGCIIDPGESEISLGNDVGLGVGVILTAVSHNVGPSTRRAVGSKCAPITIGNGAWIGAGVIVLPGVTIGAGCIIGAGAVVTKDTEPDSVYAGVPARKMRNLPADGEKVEVGE